MLKDKQALSGESSPLARGVLVCDQRVNRPRVTSPSNPGSVVPAATPTLRAAFAALKTGTGEWCWREPQINGDGRPLLSKRRVPAAEPRFIGLRQQEVGHGKKRTRT
jgi:hypothetical protein